MPLIGATLSALFQIVFSIVMIPIAMEMTIQYLKGETVWIQNGYLLGVSLFLIQLISALLKTFHSGTNRRIHVMISSMLRSSIYRKMFRISLACRKQYSDGFIMNIINNDVKVLADLSTDVTLFWSIPVRIVVAVLFLISRLGVSVLFGLVVALISIGVTLSTGKVLGQYFMGFMKTADKRIHLVRQFVLSIKIIKYRALEEYFVSKISAIRNEEIEYFKKIRAVLVSTQSLSMVSPVLMPVVTFASVALLSKELEAEYILPAIYLFVNLGNPLLSSTHLVERWFMLKVTWKRVAEFLESPEEESHGGMNPIDPSNDHVITLKNASFRFHTEQQDFLRGLNLNIHRGELVMVVGKVGSGKTALLQALLGQMLPTGGDSSIVGSIANTSQSPWLLSSTLQENILFFTENDQCRLDRVLDACQLREDLQTMPNGLDTILTENGKNMSGGQRARIALARALYQDASVYLLDDPFSALDSQVGSAIFQKVILESLKDKTVILATHSIQHLQHADMIVFMGEGGIMEQGTFENLMNSKGLLYEMAMSFVSGEKRSETVQSTMSEKKEGATEHAIEEEEVSRGSVTASIYKVYLQSLGVLFPIITLVCALASVILGVLNLLYLARSTVAESLPENFVLIYTLLGASTALNFAFCFFAIAFGCLVASRALHDAALHGIVSAPLSFFESNPSGRIMNRFSSDIQSLDIGMVDVLVNLILSATTLAQNAALIAQAHYYILIIEVIVLIVAYALFSLYQKSNREMKRNVSLLKSPMDSHVSESLSGRSLIVSTNKQDTFQKQFHVLLDNLLVAEYIFLSLKLWVNIRMQLLAALLTLSLVIVGTSLSGGNDPSIAVAIGVGLTASLGFADATFLTFIAMGEGEAEVR
jgi:ABC-type multidrug transport system fused ATPase/permease subunit